MPYSKTQWAAGDPITQDRLNKMEQGIADAYDKSETATNTVQNLNGTVSGHTTSINNLTSTLSTTTGIANTAYNMGEQGATAYSQIQGAIAESTDLHSAFPNLVSLINNIYSTIKTNKSAIENTVSQQAVNITTISNEVTAARGQTKYTSIGNAPNLKAKIDDMEHQIDSNITAIGVINGALEDARGDYNSVQLRFEQDESDIDALQTEVNGAHTGSATTLNERFTANETAIGERILISSIRDNLTSNDDKAVLSAAQGKVLKDMIGSGFDSLNTVAASITKVANDAQSYVDNNKVDKTDIVKNLTHADDDDTVLQARQGKLLQDAIDAINNTIGGSYNESNTVNNAIATAKAEAISAAAEDATTKANAAKGYADSLIYNGLDQTTAGKALDATQGKILNDAITDPDSGLAAIKTIADDATESIEGINDIIGQGFDSTNTIASMVSTINQTLNNKADTSTVNNISNTIVKAKADVAYTGTTPSATQTWTINDKDDYLLQAADDKYYYWKHINNEWHLMGGAGNSEGGGGTSSAAFAASLEAITEPDPNTDYFVGNSDDGYLHYRFIEIEEVLTPVLIGNDIDTANIKRYNIDTGTETINENGQDVQANFLYLYEFNYGEDNSRIDSDKAYLSRVRLPSGGSGVVSTQKITRIGTRNITHPFRSEAPVYLRFFYTSGEAGAGAYLTLTGNGQTIVNHEAISSGDPENASTTWPTTTPLPIGFYSYDISSYCTSIGSNQSFIITIADADDPSLTKTMQWDVNVINLTLTSNFTENPIVELGESVTFTYIPTGNIEKTAHFLLDNTEIGTVNLGQKTNSIQTYSIAAQPEGPHKLEVYLTASTANGTIQSQSVYRDIIWYNSESDNIVIASPYRNNTVQLKQYASLEIPYTIVGGNTSSYHIKYFVDDFENSVNEVDINNAHSSTWTYRADLSGEHSLRIQCGTTYITINLSVENLDIDIAPHTDNLLFDFNPSGITNESTKRLWTNGTYSLSVSDNFDWYNGGYGTDANGSYFLVKAGSRAIIDYKMFKSYNRIVNDITVPSSVVFRDGAEFKIIFKTSAVRNADAVWFTNMAPTSDTGAATNVGIQLNAHNGWLKTSAASDSIKSYLYFPYSEEDKIELDININPETAPNAVYIMSYEDGCPSRAYPYTSSQALYQASGSESPLIIGSDDCDVYIYRMRAYSAALDTEEVLRNFIADGKDVDECISRYNRNCIYYDTQNDEYTPYATPDTTLDPEKLAVKLPDVKILMLDAPRFTTEKKDFVPYSTLRCIHAPGGKVYPSRGKEDNWFFGNGYHSGQGTTSDKYGDSGRNVDFLFNCDGTHNPSDKVKPDKGFIPGYKSYVIKGYGTDEEEEPEYCSDWKGDDCKVSLTGTSIPNNFFNLKVNIASSENVNNALFQKRYNDYLPYESLAKIRDSRIKNDMEFVPALLFIRENDETFTEEMVNGLPVRTYTNHKEFNDTNWHFYALGNIGDSKKTDYTRAYDPTDMNEFTLEISDNNTNNSQFQSGVYMKNGVRTIEPYTLEQDMDDGKIVEGSFTANSEEHDITVETMDYVYPIDKETEWEALDENGNPKNMRYWSLMNEGFDGDHSFEMRYACKGDYRDGKVVNDTTGNAKAQLALNTKVWQAFYTWLVTSDDATFIAELDQWCVRSSVAYFYAFTHYYTMIDNRAKNTFWHFAKTGKYRRVTHPVKELLHVYEVSEDAVESTTTPGTYTGTFAPCGHTEIDPDTTYYTQYAFDMWAYDMDTAAGIDNNGELIFPYGKEDTDYRIENDKSSGPVYNGAGSIFWARLRENCNTDIVNAFTGVPVECFSANNLINQFDAYQNCFPEAIWRLDVERKYIRPFTGDKGIQPSNPNQEIYLTRQNLLFLRDMMQGRKKYQRRQWIKDQSVYFGSKYMLTGVSDNQLDMTCYTVGGQEVLPNWDLTITPYQDMYLNVDYGETKKSPVRAKAGRKYEITCPFSSMNESRIRIYGADYIQALAGKPIKDEEGNIIGANSLASLYFHGNNFSHTNKLRELYIGSSNNTYTNTQFTSLTLNAPILEILDIQNCDGLGGALDLKKCTSLKRLEAQGTQLTSIDLPGSTNIETLHLPSTINSLTLYSAKKLSELTIKTREGVTDTSNLGELVVSDSDYSNNINWMSIAAGALAHLNSLFLQNLRLASIVNITELEPFALRKRALETQYDMQGNLITKLNLTGILNVTGVWSQVEKDNYAGTSSSTWPDLTLNTLEQNKEERWQVVYKYPDEIVEGTVIPGDIIYSTYVNNDATIEEIYPSVISTMPSKASTVSTNYTFGSYRVNGSYIPLSGWKISTDTQPLANYDNIPTVRSNLVIHPYFRESERTYQVKWFLNEDNTQEIPTSYNAVAYGGGFDLIAPTVADIHNTGYETATVNINTNVNPVTATYRIFTGWNKLPTNISPSANDTSYNIYATWDSGTESLAQIFETIGSDGLTPKQLLVLSGINNKLSNTIVNTKGITAGMKSAFYLGYDGFKPGTILIEKNNPNYYYRGVDPTESVTTTTIAPLADNKAFTLAIDYYFDPNQTYSSTTAVAAVLAGCYENSQGSIRGFGLFQGLSNELSGIRVGFGEMFNYTQYSVQVGIPGQRNIVVLRHPANSEYLYVYSGTTAAGLLTNPVAMQSISRNIETTGATNALLNFGQLGTSSSLDSTTKTMVTDAEGTIYWAKYWDEDLGAGECEQIATWPREKMTFALSGMKDTYSIGLRSGSSSETVSPSLELLTLSSSQHAKIHYPSFQAVNTIGWGRDTDLRNLFNNILYNSLPLELKSILYKGDVYSQPAQYSSVNSESRYTILTQPDLTRDYVYNLSMANITNSDNPASYAREVANMNGLLPWLDNANVVVYNYNAQLATRWAENSSNTTRASYLTLRFPGVPAPVAGMRVFVHAEGMSETTYYQAVSKISGGIKAGDIYDISGTAYIYVTSEAIMAGIPIETGSAFQCVEGGQTVGGWVAAEPYALRSMQPGENSRTNYRYMSTGGTSAANITSTGYTANINYAFQI